ncbi:MAG: type 1 glutamine amidotransferase [Silicimonas sp.]|jgi:GMP synthase (glutamine-hydrolysing)|nr:type 1 glutamine amidotransferase [Silicimonas sp.]
MKIGILQCGHFPTAEGYPEHTYGDLYAGLLAGRGLDFQTWSVVDMEFPDSVEDADGWLISGSKHGAYEDEPFIRRLEEFIREAYAKNIPLVGICFGHQIIAQALGGKVEKFSGGWSLGRQVYDIEGGEVALNAWHQDQITRLPEDATVIGRSANCEYAALAYKGRAFSVQPHPEFSDDEVSLLLKVRRAALNETQAETVRENLGKPLANAALGDRIAAFFKESAHG